MLAVADCIEEIALVLTVRDGDDVGDGITKEEMGDGRVSIACTAHMNAKRLPGIGHLTTAHPSRLILSFRFFKWQSRSAISRLPLHLNPHVCTVDVHTNPVFPDENIHGFRAQSLPRLTARWQVRSAQFLLMIHRSGHLLAPGVPGIVVRLMEAVGVIDGDGVGLKVGAHAYPRTDRPRLWRIRHGVTTHPSRGMIAKRFLSLQSVSAVSRRGWHTFIHVGVVAVQTYP